jgi:hypothetical protein
MPPQQPDRLLDLADDLLDFRAHGSPEQVSTHLPPAGCSVCARLAQWAPMQPNLPQNCAGTVSLATN